MKQEILIAFVNNAALLLALAIIYEFSYNIPNPNKRIMPIINGLAIGLIGVLIMSIAFKLAEGAIFDARSILIGTAGLVFGAIPTAIAAGITIIYRLIQGGAGAYAGSLVIISCALIGLFWRKFLVNKRLKLQWLNIYAFGVVLHIAMLLCMLTLPRELSMLVLSQITLPVLIIYPVATVLLAMLLLHQKDRGDAMAQIKAAEERFRTLVLGAPDAIFIQTKEKFAFLNPAALKLFGAENPNQLLGTSVFDRFHPDYHELAKNRVRLLNEKKLSQDSLEQIFIRLDGSPVYVDVSGVPIHYENADGAMVFARDISERKKLETDKLSMEAQIRQQQKLEAIGTLAGGVAHEINNPINGIMNYAQLILDSLDKGWGRNPDESTRPPQGALTMKNEIENDIGYAREIIHETERVSSIVENLLQFSRQEKKTHSYADISDIIMRTVSLIRTIIKMDQITLTLDIEEKLPKMKCRSQQIQQVIMNLLTNARDAVNEKYPGFDENKVIDINCRQFNQDGRRWMRIIVTDNGCGIPKDVQDKIFEPFFSSKPKEKGTGLGLAISHGIVKDHHGTLTFETQEGEYTRFILELPVDNGWDLSSDERSAK